MNDTPRLSVLVADDHTLVRHGIKTILDGADRYEVVGEARDADETMELLASLKPDILLLDIGLPSKSGIEVIYELREKQIPITIVVLTMHENEIMAKQALSAGAMAYILKDFTPEGLLQTIDKAVDGERVVPPQFQHIIEEIERKGPSISGNGSEADPLSKLSRREREVFFLLADGMPNRTIAKKLFISPRTVETHRARVIKKLGFKSTADLIRYAIKNNLLTP